MKNYIEFINNFKKLEVKDFLIYKGVSQRQIAKSYRNGNIMIGDRQAGFKNNVVYENEVVRVILEDEIEEIKPEKYNLKILYEDDNILVVDKPPYMVVHPTKSHQSNTLANKIAYYYKENSIKRKIRFVNRLDMNTSGIVVVAKDAFSHSQLGIDLENCQIDKKYMTVVEGKFEILQGTIDLPIDKISEDSFKRGMVRDGSSCVTHFTVIDTNELYSLVEVSIPTGKSHQIRAHMSIIGHPVAGDSLYGREGEFISRQALHSYMLMCKHPVTGDVLKVCSELPEDFLKCAEYCGFSKAIDVFIQNNQR